jgi:hypothetical protein
MVSSQCPIRLLYPTCPLPAGKWAAGVGDRRLIGLRSRRLAPSPSWARMPGRAAAPGIQAAVDDRSRFGKGVIGPATAPLAARTSATP